MTSNLKLIALFSGVLLVAACDEKPDSSDNPKGLATLGAAFAAMFNADLNDEPVDAQSVNIGFDLTTEPFNP